MVRRDSVLSKWSNRFTSLREELCKAGVALTPILSSVNLPSGRERGMNELTPAGSLSWQISKRHRDQSSSHSDREPSLEILDRIGVV